MWRTLWPSSPTRFAAGTSQSSKTSSPIDEARQPSLPVIFWPSLNPGKPFSTMNVEIAPPSVRA